MKESIIVSAPGKIHLLGEHAVVYGKPALLAAINLRVTVTITPRHSGEPSLTRRLQNQDSGRASPAFGVASLARMTEIIEPIIKKEFKLKKIPPYKLAISSQIPLGSGLGSSAAISASYIAALLSFLKVKWDLELINKLTFEAEKVFHGNPSGADNSTVIFGGLIWFRKESPDLKIIQPLNIIFPRSKNFVLLHSGKPQETTKQMVKIAKPKIHSILESQEFLTRQLLLTLKDNDEKLLLQVIKKVERNLEKIGVVGKIAKKIIRDIEKLGGAAKISGAGGVKTGSGMLLVFHNNPQIILKYAKKNNLDAFIIKLGEEGLRKE